jgi:hypothetical protein
MKTFIQILQLHAKIKNISYPDNLIKKDLLLPSVLCDSSSNFSNNFCTCFFREEHNGELGFDDNTVHYQLYFFISSIAYFYEEPIYKQIRRKHFLINNAINNMFLSTKIKQYLQDIFEKTQRTYIALSRFANLVRHKTKKEKINFDLRMEPIDIRSKYAISIIQNDALYYFALTDLVNIIQTAITHSQELFENPLPPKNPYNNLPFTKLHLHNIYFRIKFAFINIPEWIQLFYNSDFDLDVFKIENEQKLRETYVKNYIIGGSIGSLYQDFMSMISYHKRIFRGTRIHKDFPKKELIDIFRPYLYLYVMSVDGIDGTEKKQLSGIILEGKLREFVCYNKNFGRKVVTTKHIDTSILLPDSSGGIFNFSLQQREVQRKTIVNITYNNNHIVFTLKDAYESFDKKKNVKPSIRSSSHRIVEEDEASLSDSEIDEHALSDTMSDNGEYVNDEIPPIQPLPLNVLIESMHRELDNYNSQTTLGFVPLSRPLSLIVERELLQENGILNIFNHLGDLSEIEQNDTDSSFVDFTELR